MKIITDDLPHLKTYLAKTPSLRIIYPDERYGFYFEIDTLEIYLLYQVREYEKTTHRMKIVFFDKVTNDWLHVTYGTETTKIKEEAIQLAKKSRNFFYKLEKDMGRFISKLEQNQPKLIAKQIIKLLKASHLFEMLVTS